MGYERQTLHPLSVNFYNANVQSYKALTIMYASLTQSAFLDFFRLLIFFKNTTFRKQALLPKLRVFFF